MKPLFLIPILLLFSSCVKTQTISEDNAELKFTQAWVWEYKNELIPIDQPGHQGEMVVYFHPEFNYLLFNFESFGTSGEMFEWVLAKPDGTYTIHAKDEFGKSIFWEEKIEFPIDNEIPAHFKHLNKTKAFNRNNLGFDEISGKAYELNYEMTEEKSIVYLAEFPANFLPLYHFNSLNLEAKLPFHFPMELPQNILVLEEKTVSKQGKISMRLKMISETEHYIGTKGKK